MSLERRLLGGIALSLLLAFAALLWLGGMAIREVVEDHVVSRLRHDSEALLGRLAIDDAGRITPPPLLSPVYHQPLSGHYFVAATRDSRVVSRSLWDETLSVEPLPAGTTALQRIDGPGGQELIALATGYRKQGHDLTLLVAEDIEPLEERIEHYQWLLAGVFLALAATLLLVLRLLLRRGFQPLDRTRQALQQVADGRQQRLDEAVPDEIRPLVHELNRLLELLSQRLARSRNALGNLAHALKTPLSLLTQELEQSPEDPHRQQAFAQTERIRELIDRELRLARIAGDGVAGQRFDAADEVPALLTVLQRVYGERGLRIEHGPLPTTPLAVDREDMLELLGNLLDNACKWAASQVRLNLEPSDQGLWLRVEDDGPGVSEAERAALTRRGSRVDESRDGHGLGLAIVGDIVALYGGELRFSESPTLGGLRVEVRL